MDSVRPKLPSIDRRVLVSEVARYEVHAKRAAGRMATIYLGRTLDVVPTRIVAIKRPHDGGASDPDTEVMLRDEARLMASIRHPNVVALLDVVHEGDQLFLVME